MWKYIVIALIGLGIFIGMNFKDQIEDVTDTRQFEEIHDIFEDVSDKAADAASNLSEKLDDLKE